jgi:hypothetical protein
MDARISWASLLRTTTQDPLSSSYMRMPGRRHPANSCSKARPSSLHFLKIMGALEQQTNYAGTNVPRRNCYGHKQRMLFWETSKWALRPAFGRSEGRDWTLSTRIRFSRDLEIIDFCGLGGPGGPRNHSKKWGAKPPTFWKGFWSRRGRPDPNNLRFPAGRT